MKNQIKYMLNILNFFLSLKARFLNIYNNTLIITQFMVNYDYCSFSSFFSEILISIRQPNSNVKYIHKIEIIVKMIIIEIELVLK